MSLSDAYMIKQSPEPVVFIPLHRRDNLAQNYARHEAATECRWPYRRKTDDVLTLSKLNNFFADGSFAVGIS